MASVSSSVINTALSTLSSIIRSELNGHLNEEEIVQFKQHLSPLSLLQAVIEQLHAPQGINETSEQYDLRMESLRQLQDPLRYRTTENALSPSTTQAIETIMIPPASSPTTEPAVEVPTVIQLSTVYDGPPSWRGPAPPMYSLNPGAAETAIVVPIAESNTVRPDRYDRAARLHRLFVQGRAGVGGKQCPPRYFEDRNPSGREGHGPRPYPAEEECRNLCSPSHPDSAHSEPQQREPTFEETMEADVANFKLSLSSPSSVEDAQELMKLAEDPSIHRIDASTGSNGLPPSLLLLHTFFDLNGNQLCPMRKVEHIIMNQPGIDNRLLPDLKPYAPKGSGLSNTATKAPKVRLIATNDPNDLPNWDSTPGMLRFLKQSSQRLFGVVIEQDRMIICHVCGAMLILGHLPIGDGFFSKQPSESLDSAFIYMSCHLGSIPGCYLEVLTEEKYGIWFRKISWACFPYSDITNYTAANVTKFYADQGIQPTDFDDAFLWIASACRKLPLGIQNNREVASLFLDVISKTSDTLALGPAPAGHTPGEEGTHCPCPYTLATERSTP
ncbi:hypothetical protein C8J56DRAFT_1094343 [Mycena floridula]|nr:hypothetical protein C8J56DRAFT_1094343 [Mycena floridula]